MSLGNIGKYELLEKISEGGMGELFRARIVGPGGFERIVALKRIRIGVYTDETFIQMFVEEAKVASLLSHQNLVHLYDFGSEGDVHYLAMELVEGRDLSRVLAEARRVRQPLNLPAVLRVGHQISMGLDHLHRLRQNGQPLSLVHRDVSPQNVMLSFDGIVKLTDFGIVRVKRQERVTRVGVVKGKLGYLSPEQLSDVPLDARSDLFSLGIVLWECLTGARLFPGTSDAEIFHQVLQRPLRPPSAFNAEVSPALDAVVMRALSRDRTERYASAAALAQGLEALGLMATDAGLANEMRRLYPDIAGERKLGLASSVELAASLVSPVGLHAEQPPTLPDRGREVATEPTTAPKLPTTGAIPRTWPRQLSRRRWLAFAGAAAAALGFGWWRLDFRPEAPPTVPVHVEPHVPALAADSPAPAPATAPAVVPVPPVTAPIPSPTRQVASPRSAAARPGKTSESRRSAVSAAATVALVGVAPWAQLWVDEKAGPAPGRFSPGRWPVPAGHHTLTLRNDEQGIERSFEVDLRPGATVVLSGSLKTLEPRSVE